MAHHASLREANLARQAEWDTNGSAANNEWRMNELAGETGEVCNVLKKLHRERVGIRGSRACKDDLADEIADVIICVDLLLLTGGYPAVHAPAAVASDYDDLTLIGTKLFMAVSRLFTVLAFSDPEEIGERARSVYRVCLGLAMREGINLQMAVEKKFNETTQNNHLTTFYRAGVLAATNK